MANCFFIRIIIIIIIWKRENMVMAGSVHIYDDGNAGNLKEYKMEIEM